VIGKTSANKESDSERLNIQQMFDAIAPTYDLLNRIMSFSMDVGWRRKAVSLIPRNGNIIVLDIASGSGDLTIEILKQYRCCHVVAADFSINMLALLRKKMRSYTTKSITFSCCDAQWLPYKNNIFDVTIVAFGIRNFPNRQHALKEMFRVLKPGGISIILELTKPTNKFVSLIYNFYARQLIPLVGRFISRHNSAYRYLTKSIDAFPKNEDFIAMMKNVGFEDRKITLLTFGAATIYSGKKCSLPRV